MFVAKKFAAFGAAAAISVTGLVAATGVSANAANVTKSVTYNCDLSGLGQGTQPVTAAYSIPAFPASLPAGTVVAKQSITAKMTLPTPVSALIVAGFEGKIDGSVSGDVTFGSTKVASSLTIPSQTITDATAPATVNASGTLAGFTAGTAGAQAVKLPSAVTAKFQNDAVTVQCTAAPGSDLSLGSVTVTKSSTGGGTNAALQKAEAKLKQDQAKLNGLKKGLKKAKGHKKAALQKKIAKLNKTIKADKAAVAAAK